MLPDINLWRRKFIDLAEDVCRLQGIPAPPLLEGFDKSLIVSVNVNGVVVNVIHADPDDTIGRLLLQCRIAGMQDPHSGDAIRKALMLNHHLAHNLAGMYALDESTEELVYCHQMPLAHVNAQELMEVISATTATAVVLQHGHFDSPPSRQALNS